MSDTGKAKSPCCGAPVIEREYRSLLLGREVYICSECGATLKLEGSNK